MTKAKFTFSSDDKVIYCYEEGAMISLNMLYSSIQDQLDEMENIAVESMLYAQDYWNYSLKKPWVIDEDSLQFLDFTPIMVTPTIHVWE